MGEVAPELYTQDGTVDIKGNPALKQNTGNWRACPYILGTHHCSALLCSVLLHCSNALFLSALLCFSIAV
jgi:hypothetical protein